MTRNSLLLMFVLVLVVGAASWFLGREDKPTDIPTSPLASIDFSSIKNIRCTTRSHGSWEIATRGVNRLFTSEEVAQGRPVAVNEDLYGRIVGFLQDARPSVHRSVSEINLTEWGLQPAAIVLEIEDGGGSHTFEIGKPDMNRDVLIRARGADRVFAYPARVVGDLSRGPKWFRDPRLCDIPSHLADRFEFERLEGESFALVRSATHWHLEFSDGERRRARNSAVERVAAAIAGARADPVDKGVSKDAVQAQLKVTVHGMGRQASFEVVSFERGKALARRGDEPDLRSLESSLLRYIDVKAADLEDTSLIGIDASELAGISIQPPSGRPLRLEKRNRFWSLRFGTTLSWLVDGNAMREFETAMLGLETRSRSARTEKRKAVYRMEIGFDPDLELPPVQIGFSAADSQGCRFAWRSDENIEYVVGPEAGQLLDTRYWNLMARFVNSGSAGQVNELSIRDREGVTWVLRRTTRGDNWELSDKQQDGLTVDGFTAVDFPSEFVTGVLNFISQLNVRGYEGEKKPEEIKKRFASPVYEVSWKYPEPTAAEGADAWAPCRKEQKRLVIGARIDDTLLSGRFSDFPALVFAIAGTDLLAIDNALKYLRQ